MSKIAACMITTGVVLGFILHGLMWDKREYWPLTRWPMYSRDIVSTCNTLLSLHLEVLAQGKSFRVLPQQIVRYSNIGYDYIYGVRLIVGALEAKADYTRLFLDGLTDHLNLDEGDFRVTVYLNTWDYGFSEFHENYVNQTPSATYQVGELVEGKTRLTPLKLAEPVDCVYELSFLKPLTTYE